MKLDRGQPPLFMAYWLWAAMYLSGDPSVTTNKAKPRLESVPQRMQRGMYVINETVFTATERRIVFPLSGTA